MSLSPGYIGVERGPIEAAISRFERIPAISQRHAINEGSLYAFILGEVAHVRRPYAVADLELDKLAKAMRPPVAL